MLLLTIPLIEHLHYPHLSLVCNFGLFYGHTAAEGHDVLILLVLEIQSIFKGGVTFLDTDETGLFLLVFSDGNSNEVFQMNLPGHLNSLSWHLQLIWYSFWFVASATAPTFAD